MLAKTHHALVDGISGTDLLAVIMDLTADAVRPEPSEWRPHPEPTGLHLALEALENVVLSPYEHRTSSMTVSHDGALRLWRLVRAHDIRLGP